MSAACPRTWFYRRPLLELWEERVPAGSANTLAECLPAAIPAALLCVAASGTAASPYAVTWDNDSVAGASLVTAPPIDHEFTPPQLYTIPLARTLR